MTLRPLALLPVLALAACVTPPPDAPKPAPAMPAKVVQYTCAGSKHMSVSYGSGTATLAGPEMLLAEEGNANRYSWPSDGTHHVWELGGDGLGTLSLRDGAKGTETVVMSACKADAVAG